MRIKWWGHAAFLITDDNGIKIITDPYGEDFPYQSITDEADIVTISHNHYDHNAEQAVAGNPEVIKDTGEFKVKGIKITGVESNHDDAGGEKRGDNIIYRYDLDGIKVAHLGDLGHIPSDSQFEVLHDVNVLFVPVGGNYTINADEARKVCEQIEPEIIIPMHYKTPVLEFPIKGVEDFIARFDDEEISRPGKAEVEVRNLPDKRQVIVLNYVK